MRAVQVFEETAQRGVLIQKERDPLTKMPKGWMRKMAQLPLGRLPANCGKRERVREKKVDVKCGHSKKRKKGIVPEGLELLPEGRVLEGGDAGEAGLLGHPVAVHNSSQGSG